MKTVTIVDTGPLVALLNRNDRHHAWALARFAELTTPLATCEAVLSETCFLLRRLDPAGNVVMRLLAQGVVQVSFDLGAEFPRVRRLMERYASVPMSLADACLVRMTELHASSQVLTLDRGFSIYRRNGRQVIPAIFPLEVNDAA